jgi:hypothetical protein
MHILRNRPYRPCRGRQAYAHNRIRQTSRKYEQQIYYCHAHYPPHADGRHPQNPQRFPPRANIPKNHPLYGQKAKVKQIKLPPIRESGAKVIFHYVLKHNLFSFSNFLP